MNVMCAIHDKSIYDYAIHSTLQNVDIKRWITLYQGGVLGEVKKG